MTAGDARPSELKRELGAWGAAAIVVGTIIGSGIFLVPRTMIERVGTPEMVFAVWIFGGLLSMAGALTYAELSAAMPEAGGEYAFLREAYGPVWSFIYGWTQMWVARSGSIATLATGFAYYAATFFPGLDQVFYTVPLPIGPGGAPLQLRWGQPFAMSLIMGLALVNYFGVRIGGGVQVVFTCIKVGLIGFIIAAGLIWGASAQTPAAPAAAALTFSGFFAALVAALWAYDGWNNVTMVAAEVREPQRNLPRALIWGTAAVMAIYLLANAAYFSVLSAGEVAGSSRVAAEMMRKVSGNWGASAVSVAAMTSIFAALNGSILAGARVPYAMARDGLFFARLSRVHPHWGTPAPSIAALCGWAAVLVFSGGYDQLLTYVIFPSWILYGMTTAAVIVLRRKRPDMPRPYRTLGYPAVPVLFVLVACVLVLSTLVDSPRESLLGLVLIAAGLPFYFHWKRRSIARR
ncbi:MAG TPA: amino acid permease [Bryobacteraceae bacterium]|nr:amino acid permease [Bryobacteraceae bacterium]